MTRSRGSRWKRFLLWLWKVLPLGRGTQFAALWLLNRKFLVGVIGVVVDESGRVLLLKHSYRNEFPWGLPGGWLKRGEQPDQALARELLEEVGLRVRVVSVLDVRLDPTLPRLDLTLLARPAGPSRQLEPRDVEILAAGFYGPGQFPGRLPPPQAELVERALALLAPVSPGRRAPGGPLTRPARRE